MVTKKDLTRSNWALNLRKAMRVAGTVAQDVISLREKPTLLNYGALAVRGINTIIDNLEGEIYDYFDDWHRIDDLMFKDELMDAIKRFPTKQVGGHDSHAIMITDVYGEDVGWVRTAPDVQAAGQHRIKQQFEGPWIDIERYDETFVALGRAMWEFIDSPRVVLSASTRTRYDGNQTKVSFKPDLMIKKDVFATKRADEIYARIKKFYDAGHNRSVILIGPPGTGKTTMMKYIASLFDRVTMRINVSELDSLRTETAVAAVQLLKPEVLLIDDFDRFGSRNDITMLTELEEVNRAVRVFIVSVNDISHIDPAMVRPGRFDEIIEIADIDEEAIDLIVSDLPEEARAIMKTWPVAYIAEFAKRIKVLGVEEAMKEVAQLRYRIQKINNSRYSKFAFGDEGLNDAVEEYLSGQKPTKPDVEAEDEGYDD